MIRSPFEILFHETIGVTEKIPVTRWELGWATNARLLDIIGAPRMLTSSRTRAAIMLGMLIAASAITISFQGDRTTLYSTDRWACEYVAHNQQTEKMLQIDFRVAGRELVSSRIAPRWTIASNDDRQLIATSTVSWVNPTGQTTTANNTLTIDKRLAAFHMDTTYFGQSGLDTETRAGKCQRE